MAFITLRFITTFKRSGPRRGLWRGPRHFPRSFPAFYNAFWTRWPMAFKKGEGLRQISFLSLKLFNFILLLQVSIVRHGHKIRSDKKSSFLDPDSIPDSNYSTFSLLNSSRNINFQTAIYKVNLIPFVVLDYSSLTELVTMPMTFSFGYLPAIILLPGCPEDALTRRKKVSLAHCLLHLIASHHILERSKFI
jgi:hypothetical protein